MPKRPRPKPRPYSTSSSGHQTTSGSSSHRFPSRSRGNLIGGLVGALLLATLIGAGLLGCQTGAAARENVLRPNLTKAYKQVIVHVENGIHDAVDTEDLTSEGGDQVIAEANRLTDAFNTAATQADLVQALTVWPMLEPFAQRGVTSRNISPALAQTHFETIRLFNEAVILYSQRLE